MGGPSMEGAGPNEEKNIPESALGPRWVVLKLTDLRLQGHLAAHQRSCWSLCRPGSAGGALEPPQGTDLEPLGAEQQNRVRGSTSCRCKLIQ